MIQSTLTNGLQNWLFQAKDNQVTIFVINEFGFIEKELVMGVEEGRNFYSQATKLISNISKGWAAPNVCEIKTNQNPLYEG